MRADQPPLRRETFLAAEHASVVRGLPWIPLAHVPTPVEPCDAIAPWLGHDGVWIKRDDLVSPRYGGNKVRRYEYLLGEARARGADTLVTAGGLGSTQVLATVLHGRALGFDVVAALFDQPVTRFVQRMLLTDSAAGARLLYGGSYAMTALHAWQAHRDASRPYLVLPGASTPVANLGYVDAMLELAAQVERGEAPRPDRIVVASGSAGTLVGLSLGVALLGWPTRVVGVRITDWIACNRLTVRLLTAATARWISARAPATTSRLASATFEIDHREAGPGYGHATPSAIEAAAQLHRLTGTPGEITYTGKALAALRTIAAEHPHETILYWHTLSHEPPAPPPETIRLLPPELARLVIEPVVC